MDESRDASFGLRRVEIGIVGDSVVSRVVAAMALPKGLLWKEDPRKIEEARERDGGEAKEREANKKRH